MSANDLDPIAAAIKNARDKKQAQTDKATQIANTSQQYLVKVADKALAAIKDAFAQIKFFDGKANVHARPITIKNGQQFLAIIVDVPLKDGISVSAIAELTWVNGDGGNIGHGEGGDIIGTVIGQSGKTSQFHYSVGQQPFQANYSVDAGSLERKIAQAVAEVVG